MSLLVDTSTDVHAISEAVTDFTAELPRVYPPESTMATLIDVWIKFFREAGITNGTTAALYATTFADNEIQEDMVGDLNRDILREMGITVMGHVLAILKHAKIVHSKAESEKIVAKTNPPRMMTPVAVSMTDNTKKSTPASRIIEHYVRSELSPPQVKSPLRLGTTMKKQILPQTKLKITDRLGASVVKQYTTPSAQLKVTDRLGILNPSTHQPIKKKQVITLRSDKLTEEVPVKRVRRVLPEEEGGYKITMPSGTTPKTKELLAKQSRLNKTVFDRLGDGSVSSTTEFDEPKITITGLLPQKKTSVGGSVFSRLGGKPEISSTVTSSETQPMFTRSFSGPPEEPIGYFGVLKKTVNTPTMTGRLGDIVPISSLYTRTYAKEVSQPTERNKTEGILAKPNNAIKPSAKSRLGQTEIVRKSLDTGSITKTKRKKFILIKKSGEREIVYRDVVEQVQPILPESKPNKMAETVKKSITFDAATRSKFRSDNIAVVAGINSRLGPESQEEEEWDY